ncbi:hypothetical protein JG687_00005916 [Phytophthora cactorum]|uniref:DDE-1 domain-containing protein n=1 Tax=Phytophthora cactorum TaxID=29920 RepID=A0A8T1ULS8_9STRA|nr:hypothetical protein JG687_00005916 [Phytophthora cactorum]
MSERQRCFYGNKKAPFLVFKTGVSHHQHIQDDNVSMRHGFGISLWKDIFPLQIDHDCQIYANPSAWWNAEISLNFLRHHFGHRDNMDDKILLLWGDVSGHWTQDVMDNAASINVVLLKVPTRYTYACQPADVAWNHPFKTRLCRRWVERLRARIANHHAQERIHAAKARESTNKIADIASKEIQAVAREKIAKLQAENESAAFELVAPKRQEITAWIAESWTELSATTIVSGFERLSCLGILAVLVSLKSKKTLKLSVLCSTDLLTLVLRTRQFTQTTNLLAVAVLTTSNLYT